MIPAVPTVVPAALPGTYPWQIFFNGNTCPRYRRQSACSTERVELSSTFQAILVPQADEKFNGNIHPRYRQSAADKLLICRDFKQPIRCVQDGAICQQRFVQRGVDRFFLSFSSGEHERKRARYQQRNLMDCIQNYRPTFHFIRNIGQTAVVSILELKIIGHNHENDEKL